MFFGLEEESVSCYIVRDQESCKTAAATSLNDASLNNKQRKISTADTCAYHCIPLAYRWPTISRPLADHWLTIGLPLAYYWPIINLPLACHWLTIVPLAYHWPTICQSLYHWPTIVTFSYHWPAFANHYSIGLQLAYQ